MKTTRIRLLAVTAALAVAAVACGGGSTSTDPTTTTTTGATATTTTAAVTTTAAGSTTTVAAATTTAAPGTTVAGEGVELVIEAEDSEGFSVSRLEAPVGEITVTFVNKDIGSGEPHNWHVDVGGEQILTPITDGPDTQSVTFTVDTPGLYDYFCDTHLTAMTGTLVVSP